MSETITTETEFKVCHCSECGMPYALTERFHYRRKNDGKTWYCPNGHGQCICESEVQRLNRELTRIKRNAEFDRTRARELNESLGSVSRSLRATKGALTKTKNRIANGVCPCCKRSFTNLHRHMETKHPKYVATKD